MKNLSKDLYCKFHLVIDFKDLNKGYRHCLPAKLYPNRSQNKTRVVHMKTLKIVDMKISRHCLITPADPFIPIDSKEISGLDHQKYKISTFPFLISRYPPPLTRPKPAYQKDIRQVLSPLRVISNKYLIFVAHQTKISQKKYQQLQ